MASRTEQIIVFDVEEESFGVNITQVDEIVRMKKITELPTSSQCIAGVINLRGDIITVIDLRRRLGIKEAKETEDTRIIVVEFNNQYVGLIVDAVSEVLHVEKSEIDDPPKSMAGIKNEFLRGIVKIDEDIIILLNLDNLLESKEEINLDQNT